MATLVYSDADGIDHSFALSNEPVVVGRDPNCGIRSNDPRVSRHHARFFIEQGALWVEDLGSSNGIFVGPNKVQRAPVPTGEIMLVGSLMIRLLPASGTLPPPMGLHGTLATWLDLERKTRSQVEQERDAFAVRVGELHQQIAALKVDAPRPEATSPLDAEAIRQRDEAEARVEGLQNAIASLQGALDEARATQSVHEHVHAEASRETQALRDELDMVRRSSMAELEIARMEAAKLREQGMVADATAGIAQVEKLALADATIAAFEKEIEALRAQLATATAPAPATTAASDQAALLTAAKEKAEKDLAAAQIRAQGAERNLAGANAQAAKAETRAAAAEEKVADIEARAIAAELTAAQAAERIAQLEARLGAGDAPLQAAEARATQVAGELAARIAEAEAATARATALETALAAATAATEAATAKTATAIAEAEAAATARRDGEARAKELQAKLDALASAESTVATAKTVAADASAAAQAAEQRATDAERRANDAEQRASAADTMAKAMAKDVAEALRRAADADQRAKGQVRDVADAIKRAAEAEERMASSSTVVAAAEERATAAEARVAAVTAELESKAAAAQKALEGKLVALQSELAAQVAAASKDGGERLAATQKELGDKLLATQQELGTKLEATQRELAAERSGLLSLVDRKTQLERELAEALAGVPDLEAQLDDAETKLVEADREIEALQERVTDLESGMAVSETAALATLDESRARMRQLEAQLVEVTASRDTLDSRIEPLVSRIAELEGQLAATITARTEVEASLTAAQRELAELNVAAGAAFAAVDTERTRLAEAVARAEDAERQLEDVRPRADNADLAIGRAGALQRQLDEALLKLSWLERDAQAKGQSVRAQAEAEAALAALEASARETTLEFEAKLREAEDRLTDTEEEMSELRKRLHEAERRVQTTAERRAESPSVNTNAAILEQKLAMQAAQIIALQHEVEAAENVRSFAAETEREIAQFQRDLKEARQNLAAVTLERDRLEAEVRDARGEDTSTTTRAPAKSAGESMEITAQAQYQDLLRKATAELAVKLEKFERQDAELRARLHDAETRVRAAEQAGDAEATRTGQVPLQLAEYVSVLEESIDSLRANMRAASDETAMLPSSPSVSAIEDAVSAAAEHVERARAAIRSLQAVIGL